MRIDADELCRDVLARRPSEGDVDAQVRAICRERFGDEHEVAAEHVMAMISKTAGATGTSLLGAVEVIATMQAEVVFSRETWSSVEDMPPEVRQRVLDAMRGDVHWKAGSRGRVSVAVRTTGRGLRRDVSLQVPDAPPRQDGAAEFQFRSHLFGDLDTWRRKARSSPYVRIALVILMVLLAAVAAALCM